MPNCCSAQRLLIERPTINAPGLGRASTWIIIQAQSEHVTCDARYPSLTVKRSSPRGGSLSALRTCVDVAPFFPCSPVFCGLRRFDVREELVDLIAKRISVCMRRKVVLLWLLRKGTGCDVQGSDCTIQLYSRDLPSAERSSSIG
jgi:hypothetical protein